MVYDFLRALRKTGFNSFFAVFVGDVLFWVFSAFVTFIFLMARTYGEIRGYVMAGEIVGFLLFRITFSRVFFVVLKIILNAIKKIYLRFERIVNAVYLKTDRILTKIRVYTAQKFKRTAKSVKKLLKSGGKVLYTNKNSNDAEYVLNETKT